MLSAGDTLVWKALADSTRREIVESLTAGPRTTGDLVAQFAPRLVRTAVMKHLDVLAEAGVVRIERSGRTRWNSLEAKPLSGVAEWLKRRVLTHQANLQRLKSLAESAASHRKSTHQRNKQP